MNTDQRSRFRFAILPIQLKAAALSDLSAHLFVRRWDVMIIHAGRRNSALSAGCSAVLHSAVVSWSDQR